MFLVLNCDLQNILKKVAKMHYFGLIVSEGYQFMWLHLVVKWIFWNGYFQQPARMLKDLTSFPLILLIKNLAGLPYIELFIMEECNVCFYY